MREASFEVIEHLMLYGEPPDTVLGKPVAQTMVVSAPGTFTDGIRFSGSTAINKWWFSVRYKENVFPGSYNRSSWHKRDIHMVIMLNSKGHWVTRCGSWGPAWIDEKYLPTGCDYTKIGSWDGLD